MAAFGEEKRKDIKDLKDTKDLKDAGRAFVLAVLGVLEVLSCYDPPAMGARARAFRRTLFLLAVLSLAGCSGEEAESGRTYTVRGQVTQLPDPNNPGTGLYVNHEAIDDFVDREGEVVGMDPMPMPFPVDEKVSLEGIVPGDVVELELHVDWGAETEAEIVGIRELPPGTKLEFRAAKPPKTTQER